jgi:hypothetical protein
MGTNKPCEFGTCDNGNDSNDGVRQRHERVREP